MTKEEYLEREYPVFVAALCGGLDPAIEQAAIRDLAAAWHSLTDSDRTELDARPPVPGRPRFVSAGVTLRPTQGFMDLVSGAADNAVEGK